MSSSRADPSIFPYAAALLHHGAALLRRGRISSEAIPTLRHGLLRAELASLLEGPPGLALGCRKASRPKWSTRPFSCPSWDRTRTLLIPYHFGFRRRPFAAGAFVVWTVPSPSPAIPCGGQAAPIQSLHLPGILPGLGSALPVKGSPTLRAFTRALSGAVSSGRAARVRRVASYTKGQLALPARTPEGP